MKIRVIIEITPKEDATISKLVETGQIEREGKDADAGAPAESLFQSQATEAPESSAIVPRADDIDVGPPSEWLVDAIQADSSTQAADTYAEVDTAETLEAGATHPAVTEAAHATPIPDDLKVIEGIGPKISSLLQENGIMTFAQLAATEVDQLQRILREARITLADPRSWREQAGLAAAGEGDALETLQDELKRGRYE